MVHRALKRGLAYFFADDRDLTGCRYYVGHCCRASGFVHRLALTFRRSGVSLSLSLSLSHTHMRARARARPRTHARTQAHTQIGRSFRSADPILYLLYRGDQSRRIPRACAARNERSPVLSVFPSVCPEDRSPSIPPTRSPLVPLLGSPSASTFELVLSPGAPGRFSSLASWLPRCSISRLSAGTDSSTFRYARAPRCAFCTFFAGFI